MVDIPEPLTIEMTADLYQGHVVFMVEYPRRPRSAQQRNRMSCVLWTCACGRVFWAKVYQLKKGSGHTCGLKCPKRGLGNQKPTPLVCAYCGTTRLVSPHYASAHRYCSLACAGRGRETDWNQEVVRRYRRYHQLSDTEPLVCERCAVTSVEKRIHISRRNKVKTDLRPGNLAALCEACSLAIRRGNNRPPKFKRIVDRLAARQDRY